MTGKQKSIRASLGQQVRHFRADLGINQDELAARCDLSRDMISRVERGTISCSLETLEKLAAALGVAPANLLGGKAFPTGSGSPRERAVDEVMALISTCDTAQLAWLAKLIQAALRKPR